MGLSKIMLGNSILASLLKPSQKNSTEKCTRWNDKRIILLVWSSEISPKSAQNLTLNTDAKTSNQQCIELNKRTLTGSQSDRCCHFWLAMFWSKNFLTTMLLMFWTQRCERNDKGVNLQILYFCCTNFHIVHNSQYQKVSLAVELWFNGCWKWRRHKDNLLIYQQFPYDYWLIFTDISSTWSIDLAR